MGNQVVKNIKTWKAGEHLEGQGALISRLTMG